MHWCLVFHLVDKQNIELCNYRFYLVIISHILMGLWAGKVIGYFHKHDSHDMHFLHDRPFYISRKFCTFLDVTRHDMNKNVDANKIFPPKNSFNRKQPKKNV